MSDKDHEFELVCTRCGSCCGAADDPCSRLVRDDSGGYYCDRYEDRLGPQKTVSGQFFTCVSIRDHIHFKTLREKCAYARFS